MIRITPRVLGIPRQTTVRSFSLASIRHFSSGLQLQAKAKGNARGSRSKGKASKQASSAPEPIQLIPIKHTKPLSPNPESAVSAKSPDSVPTKPVVPVQSTSGSTSPTKFPNPAKSGTKSSSKPRIPLVRPLLIILGLGGSVYVIDREYYSSLLSRSIRALYVMAWIAYQYARNTEKYANLNELHELASDRLLNLLMTNKGLYIKLGQAIANQAAILPLAYQKKFHQLYDNAPADSWDNIDKLLKKHFGPNYETEIFSEISHEPIASASIAQVHRGTLKNGDEVAVKIQHGYIEKSITVDMAVYVLVTKLYEYVFDIPMSMFSKYVSEQMIKETDFTGELRNSERLKQIVSEDSTLKNVNIYVPKAYESLSGKRILLTEWINGISLADKDKLVDQGYDLRLIMTQYLSVFGKQIFKYGFVHSDPHPGNLLARFDNKGKQQLVILDHGLYVDLSEKFRVEYSTLWKHMFSLNFEGIKDIVRGWGINSPEMFASMVQLKPVPMDEVQGDMREFMRTFIGDASKFPQELIFVGRTMRMLQNLNQQFGSPVNRINLLTKESIEALVVLKPASFEEYFNLFKIKTTLFLSDLLFYAIRLRQILLGDKYGGQGIGAEDMIDVYMQNTAKSMGFEVQ